MAALNPRQINFCNEYVKDYNATQAAIRAKYSAKTAGSQAHDLLKKPEVQALIETLKADAMRALHMGRDEILFRLASVVRHDSRKLLDPETGDRKKAWEVDESTWINQDVKASDRNKALELLARHANLFAEEGKTAGAAVGEALAAVLKRAQDNGEGVGSLIGKS
jgi:phage terminase small subunit